MFLICFSRSIPISYDWPLCIDVQKAALLRLTAGVVAMLGSGEVVTRAVWLAVLAFLRPAEAAVRRLVAIAARGLTVAERRGGALPVGGIPKGDGERLPVFRLFDPRRWSARRRRRGGGGKPNVRFLDGRGEDAPAIPEGIPVEISAARVRRRLAALTGALLDIEREARRLARVYRRQTRPLRPMRPGRPPGYRTRGRGEIDAVLDDCHALALIALDQAVPG